MESSVEYSIVDVAYHPTFTLDRLTYQSKGHTSAFHLVTEADPTSTTDEVQTSLLSIDTGSFETVPQIEIGRAPVVTPDSIQIRAAQNTSGYEDQRVSRNHAYMTVFKSEKEGQTFVDKVTIFNESKNGTLIFSPLAKGEELEYKQVQALTKDKDHRSQRLQNGDVIAMGDPLNPSYVRVFIINSQLVFQKIDNLSDPVPEPFKSSVFARAKHQLQEDKYI